MRCGSAHGASGRGRGRQRAGVAGARPYLGARDGRGLGDKMIDGVVPLVVRPRRSLKAVRPGGGGGRIRMGRRPAGLATVHRRDVGCRCHPHALTVLLAWEWGSRPGRRGGAGCGGSGGRACGQPARRLGWRRSAPRRWRSRRGRGRRRGRHGARPRTAPSAGSAVPGGQPARLGTPWWNKVAWIRCSQAVRSSSRSRYSCSSTRSSRACSGGIHEHGTFRSATRSRR